jgi:hypothetical protein
LKRLDKEYRLVVEKIKNNKVMFDKDESVDKNLTTKEKHNKEQKFETSGEDGKY